MVPQDLPGRTKDCLRIAANGWVHSLKDRHSVSFCVPLALGRGVFPAENRMFRKACKRGLGG
jgi:hypothetical protein